MAPEVFPMAPRLGLTDHWAGISSLAVFVIAYSLVVAEEFTQLRKSKPVMIAAGLIWLMVAFAARRMGASPLATAAARATLLQYAELLLFLLAAMTYVNAMTERNVFAALRAWLARRGTGYRGLFWLTGLLSFFLSAVIDNLTTALVMSGVILAISRNPRFVALSCINIVVAANAGGAWCGFGDITSLMVWQAGRLDFFDFFHLFLPSAVAFLVPAACMHFAIPNGRPESTSGDGNHIKTGGAAVVVLFALTLATAATFQNFLALPPVMGMMLGLGYLKLLGFYLNRAGTRQDGAYGTNEVGDPTPFDVFRYVARAEWDTLLFFYGVILCVGGLATIGYLDMLSDISYRELGPTTANVLIGILSAVVDNIPVMAAVLQMNPDMSHGQWLLVTFTAGVGGSLLSIGSAAGVALMGQARGHYTFFHHLPWAPVIAAGYAAGIWVHLLINQRFF